MTNNLFTDNTTSSFADEKQHSYLTQCVERMVLENQTLLQIVNLLFTVTN